VYAEIRKHVSFLAHDRETTSDMQALAKLIHEGTLSSALVDLPSPEDRPV
jgi:histidine ammonia-lyase